MGIVTDFINVVKNVVSPQTQTPANQTPMQTASTTTTEQNASVFLNNGVNSYYSNTASTTVILSNDYRDDKTNANYTNVWINNTGNGKDMDTLIDRAYPDITAAERNSAAAAIIDNNRWMIDNINQTYMVAQVAQKVAEQMGDDCKPEAVALVTEYVCTQLTKNAESNATQGTEQSTKTSEDTSELDSLTEALKGYGIEISDTASSEDIKTISPSEFNNIISAAEQVRDNADQYDVNVRTDQIPYELIAQTDFSSHVTENDLGPETIEKVFCPNLHTLQTSRDTEDETLSETVQFGAENKQLTITQDDLKDMSEEQVRAEIQKQIAQNYGLDDTNDDGVFDLASSYAGINILSALGKEEGNNELFDKLQEDPDKFLDAMVKQAMSEEGLTLYCPDTEINVLAQDAGEMSQEDIRKAVIAEGNRGTITYIHALEDSLVLKENGTLTGADVLAAYDFNGQTLAEFANAAVESENTDDIELALSAIKQIASNNPNMQETLDTAVNDYLVGLEDTSDTAKLSSKQLLEVYMAADLSDVVKNNGGELVLENVQYILGDMPKAATPRVIEETPETPSVPEDPSEEPSIPEDPSEEPTDPPVTDPPVTDPPITEPPITEPPVTEPPVTEPPVTEPPITEPPITEPPITEPPVTEPPITEPPVTECPELPPVDKGDDNLDIKDPDLKDPSEEPVSSEEPLPTEAPLPDIPDEPELPCPTEPDQPDTDIKDPDAADSGADFDDDVPGDDTLPEVDNDDTSGDDETLPEIDTGRDCPVEEEMTDTNKETNDANDYAGVFASSETTINNPFMATTDTASTVEATTSSHDTGTSSDNSGSGSSSGGESSGNSSGSSSGGGSEQSSSNSSGSSGGGSPEPQPEEKHEE